MRKLKYQLVKEDYKSWIHWNVLRNDSKKMKILSVVIYIVFVAIFMGGNLTAAKENPVVIFPAAALAIVVGIAMFYTTSNHNQERIIWKKSGLKKLERTNDFPAVELDLGEKVITMEVPKQDMTQVFSYKDILGILEIDRLFLLQASDKTWQFVAKSAFDSQEEMDEFKAFMEEKIEDAKENPEKYEIEKEQPERVETARRAKKASGFGQAADSESDEDEPVIQPVDVSNMGKIGKMAHIMAAMAEDSKEEREAAVKTEEQADSEEAAETETAGENEETEV